MTLYTCILLSELTFFYNGGFYTDAVLRDPVTEVGDLSYLIMFFPVQPKNVEFRATDVLVSGQLLKRLYTFREDGTADTLT